MSKENTRALELLDTFLQFLPNMALSTVSSALLTFYMESSNELEPEDIFKIARRTLHGVRHASDCPRGDEGCSCWQDKVRTWLKQEERNESSG